MIECSYWWKAEEDEWCDMTDAPCSCGGRQHGCHVGGKAADLAFREVERINLAEAAQRAKRAMREKEAS